MVITVAKATMIVIMLNCSNNSSFVLTVTMVVVIKVVEAILTIVTIVDFVNSNNANGDDSVIGQVVITLVNVKYK